MEEDEEADYDKTDAPIINPLFDAVVNNALNYIEIDDDDIIDDDDYHHNDDHNHSLAITDDDDDATIDIVNLGGDDTI